MKDKQTELNIVC